MTDQACAPCASCLPTTAARNTRPNTNNLITSSEMEIDVLLGAVDLTYIIPGPQSSHAPHDFCLKKDSFTER